MGRVTLVGSSNTDLVCRASRLPSPGETVTGSSFATYPGGKGANQAVAAARAGAEVTFVGAIGSDSFGRDRLADLEGDNIDVSRVIHVADQVSGVALIAVDDLAENQIVVVPGANGDLSPDHVRAALATDRSDVMGFVLEVPLPSVETALRLAMESSTIAVLNAAPYDGRVADLLPLVDVLICNESEASLLLGRNVAVESAHSSVRDLCVLGPSAAVITLGSDGAVVTDGDDVQHIEVPRIAVVDTTGAGDAFCGVFMAWLASGAPLWESARAGAAAGTLAATRDGAQPSLPRIAEIRQMMAHLPS